MQGVVFELPQHAIDGADPQLDADLEQLGAAGCRFSLDQVSDLDLDVADLYQRHFRFVKIEAERLLQAPDPQALKRRLDGLDLDLIVEKIESEAVLVELLDLDIDFGQGYLFGEPRIPRENF
jgi:cyclic-di-GMP phosphodiesterase TipF (flagellum assembly factor)